MNSKEEYTKEQLLLILEDREACNKAQRELLAKKDKEIEKISEEKEILHNNLSQMREEQCSLKDSLSECQKKIEEKKKSKRTLLQMKEDIKYLRGLNEVLEEKCCSLEKDCAAKEKEIQYLKQRGILKRIFNK